MRLTHRRRPIRMYKLFLINRYLRKRLIIFNRYNRTRIFRKPLGQRPRPASDFKHNIITMNISHLQQYPSRIRLPIESAGARSSYRSARSDCRVGATVDSLSRSFALAIEL